MEMPKGLQEIARVLRKDEIPTRNEVLHLVYLVKCMAAALEKGLKYEDCPDPKMKKCPIYGHDEMREALRRYKDWE